MRLHVWLALLFGLVLAPAFASPKVVKTESLRDVLIERAYTAPATAVAINTSQISAEISARIERINVKVSDIVEAGDSLATLDCRSYENALAAANAQIASLNAQEQLAQQQLERAESLSAKNNLSAEIRDQRVADLDIIKANVRAQQAALADAKLATERCSLTAPYRAAITSRLVGEGTMATPGVPLFSLVGLDAIELSAQVPTKQIAALLSSETLDFVNNGSGIAVEIRALSPVIDAASGNREVRLTAAQPLTPGTSGRLQWEERNLLPANLLSRRDGKLGVLIANNASDQSVAEFVELPGALEGRPVAVDLALDTMIVVDGRHNLANGDEITVATAQ
ncbi:MAG: efflux RND transporter periplasmic adaptor subunit [Pseudomonadota bacterium]